MFTTLGPGAAPTLVPQSNSPARRWYPGSTGHHYVRAFHRRERRPLRERGAADVQAGGTEVAWSARELAELSGTTVNAIRHYHRIGLLDEPSRRYNGYQQYGVSDPVLLPVTRRREHVHPAWRFRTTQHPGRVLDSSQGRLQLIVEATTASGPARDRSLSGGVRRGHARLHRTPGRPRRGCVP
ncbi:MerR family DNA-binding transcriptional regulator [Micromonospora sp. WMMD964]|uniref:MerR family DNA-binding transcriptional regulator n=1 Tax=Micromonospora sp. WMMD964 TaxID=3016091 RepID=UPI002499F336|nr:MerR family DNA-binding transcriptional regulator [Micromonospora sp. WMMD964]WFF00186.1 MerR family DNA-binding transcriptional regulator [Micromonospora sp. WMMD964]